MIELDGFKAYNLNEICEILHISKEAGRRYCFTGKLKAVKIGRFWHVSEPNLKAFINQSAPEKHERLPVVTPGTLDALNEGSHELDPGHA